MKSFVALAFGATAVAQSCSDSTDGMFSITTANVTTTPSKRLASRQLAGVLMISLQGGKMMDQADRIGYIASNYQFQFDNPVQTGAITESGFGICGNNSLTHDGSAIWYQCDSGNLYNLYSQSQGGQCFPIYIIANKDGGSGSAPPATQISDGQPQAPTPVTQITDGQPQAPKPTDAVTQISDGQPQAPKPTDAVTQISDGQPQAPKPTNAVTQISDGQPQAPKPTNAVTQISDGQPQAPKPTAVVTQISDGQPQAPLPGNATMSAPPQYIGAAATNNVATGAFLAGLFGLFAML